ncbi:unnamed protein product [Trichobilharzia regenti]|nr:unnamed protein product [Trichobilharzia regenti]
MKAITIALDDFVVEGMSTWPLSTFVSQASKVVLLNLATRSFDGNLIIKLINKFRNSFSESVFQHILLKNHVVALHFINFLRKTGQLADLKKYMKSDVASHSSMKHLVEISSELAVILDYQNSYEKEWNSTYNELSLDANVRKVTVTLPNTLIMQPLCETLSALVRMDQTIKANNSRAEILGKKCKMSDEQFKWLVIEPLMQSQNWNDLECILLKKIIENYLKFISDNEEFIQIAIRLKMIDEALKLCLERRNVNALKDLLSQIPSNHRRKEEMSHYLSIPVRHFKCVINYSFMFTTTAMDGYNSFVNL